MGSAWVCCGEQAICFYGQVSGIADIKLRTATSPVEESGVSATWVLSICSLQATPRGPWHTLELIPLNTEPEDSVLRGQSCH